MTLTRIAAALALTTLVASAAAQNVQRKLYIVQLVDKPLATYDGSIAGVAATRPVPGGKLNVASVASRAYASYLTGRQSQVLASVPAAPVLYRYRNVLNGFAAALTDAELAALVRNRAVQSVTADTPVPLDTSYTPSFLGINAANGAWNRLDASGRKIKGEGVIIGHVDGGVWPENPSFSDKVDANGKPVASHLPGTVVYDALPSGRWNGTCQASTGEGGQSFTAAHCNNKLIGARYFNATLKFALANGITRQWSQDYVDSPRDASGHGTHTLSTSGGNEGVEVDIQGLKVISGIAPRARVAAYRSCYVPADANDNPQQGSCFNSDNAAAIDAAVADGVDVLNFSIGGSRTSVQDAVSSAFANAAFAGVFVSTSAGNSNVNGSTTVAHVAPWTMTVGNSTHDRFGVANVTLGNNVVAQGASYQTSGLATKPLILSIEAGMQPFASLNNADKRALGRCYNATDRADASINPDGVPGANAVLDPAKITGKIVVCIRGGNNLVNKGTEVAGRGGVGMVLQNVPANALPPPLNGASADTTLYQPYAIPTVHTPAASAAAVLAHAAGGAGTAAFSAASNVAGTAAPVMAGTSSRGPNQRDPNLLKPEITAPGTDIQAAYTNTSLTAAQRLQVIAGTLVPGPGANSINGTSMAAPHVAGAAALLKQVNPTWSPFAIKSALLTSAVQNVKLANGNADGNRWGYGAGHLNPNLALDTKTVFDQSIADHVNYYFGAISGLSLNIATITVANVSGTATVARTLSNKGTSPVTYNAAASLTGFNVVVSPPSLTIAAGASASYQVTLTRTSAAAETWVFGDLVWTGSGATLYSPLTAKYSPIIALASLNETRNVGTKIYTAKFGYPGALFTTPTGLAPATVVNGSVALGQQVCFPFQVPAGAKTLRVQLFNADTEGGSASDLDLLVVRGSTTVGLSDGGSSDELVQVANPTAATNYQACVQGFAPVNNLAAFKLSYWVLGPTNTGTLRAAGPGTVSSNLLASIGMGWNVPAGARYLGVVEFRQTSAGTPIARTDLFIDSAAAAQAPVSFAPVFRMKERAAN